MSESSLHEWLWYTLGRTLGASHCAVAWIGSASVTWLPGCCRAEFPQRKTYVRSILGRSAIKACKVLIDAGTLYATVCNCDYLCGSVLMKILSKWNHLHRLATRKLANFWGSDMWRTIRTRRTPCFQKNLAPHLHWPTYLTGSVCLDVFLHSPVQKGQPWRSPYIGRSHMNLQIFLPLQDPAWSIQVVTYPFYDLVTFVIQFRQRACGHGIQDNCGITIPKLLRWALPSQYATCLDDASCAALRAPPSFLVSEFVSTGEYRFNKGLLCVWTLQTLAEVRIAIQSVAVAVPASRSVISRGLEAGGFWCVGFWCPKGRRAETCSCCSGLCHRLPCRGSANQHPTYLPIDLQQGSYYHTHTT